VNFPRKIRHLLTHDLQIRLFTVINNKYFMLPMVFFYQQKIGAGIHYLKMSFLRRYLNMKMFIGMIKLTILAGIWNVWV
jgi:hypothetical protein